MSDVMLKSAPKETPKKTPEAAVRHTEIAPQRLSNNLLSQLPNGVMGPRYDRTKITAGIVHIGLGNFHRGHQAWYIHRLMQQGEAMDWGIIGAGVRENDKATRDTLAKQDYLTTLIALDPNGKSAEIIGSIIDFVPVEHDNGALIGQMADPAIRIVSMTVTESGYFIDPVTKDFDASHKDIVHDSQNPLAPRTAFGAMIAALAARAQAGIKPFTALSCDNLQGNGDILRQTLVCLARLSNPELADWIAANVSFPNSMVDCIVPATGSNELELPKQFGIVDLAPVTHENFRQWVIEDNFCNDRPALSKVGATLCEDVHEFEAMKIRILNGGHQLIANAGEVLCIDYISQCMEHDLISAYMAKVARDEISPHVATVAGMTPEAYVDLVHKRFSNETIIDTVRRVAFDGSSRQTGFIIPTLRDAIAASGKVAGLALSQAIWARMCAGTREDGSVIEANDPLWDSLKAVALAAKQTPILWLEQRELYGDLADNKAFSAYFTNALSVIWSQGVEAAISNYLTEVS